MIIVEIGCGRQAGPFIEGADQYIAVDTNPDAVRESVARDSRMTPRVDNAETLESIDSDSVDMVLARNVFGDPNLGSNITTMFAMLQEGNGEQYKQMIRERKQRIAITAARILMLHGRLVIVEQYTPWEAEEFLDSMPPVDGLTSPTLTALDTVTSKDYANVHTLDQSLSWTTQTWALDRI